jgi:hypothetical protein
MILFLCWGCKAHILHQRPLPKRSTKSDQAKAWPAWPAPTALNIDMQAGIIHYKLTAKIHFIHAGKVIQSSWWWQNQTTLWFLAELMVRVCIIIMWWQWFISVLQLSWACDAGWPLITSLALWLSHSHSSVSCRVICWIFTEIHGSSLPPNCDCTYTHAGASCVNCVRISALCCLLWFADKMLYAWFFTWTTVSSFPTIPTVIKLILLWQ